MLRVAGCVALVCSGLFAAPRFEVKYAAQVRPAPVDGRLIVVVAKSAAPEPRFQVGWSLSTAQIFGADVDGWTAGQPVRLDGDTIGHPDGAISTDWPVNYFSRFSTAQDHP